MIITAISSFERGKNRMAVYLNEEFAFVLYKGELSKYRLAVGNELTEEMYDRILNETLYKRARLRGMNLLQKMDRTEADIKNKLKDGGYPEVVIDDAVEYLKSFHYIDDFRYAQNYIHYKQGTLSKKEIIQKLKIKGIADAVIENALFEMDDDEEKKSVKKLMIKKCSAISQLSYEEKMKLFAFLYRKGYSTDVIEHAYAELRDSETIM